MKNIDKEVQNLIKQILSDKEKNPNKLDSKNYKLIKEAINLSNKIIDEHTKADNFLKLGCQRAQVKNRGLNLAL